MHRRKGASLDHFAGRREEGLRRGEAKGLHGPEIDDELELGRLLNRKIGRLCSLENLPDVDADLTIDRGARELLGRGCSSSKSTPGQEFAAAD
jgi:hypothetical protein